MISLLWNYYLNGCDKIDSGEYALSKSPKKPGGICNLKTQKGYWKIFLSVGTTLPFLSVLRVVLEERNPR